MLVKLPFAPNAEASKALRGTLERTAAGSPLSVEAIAIAMSRFFQHLADTVADGKPVLISGFGLFAAVNYHRTQRQRDGSVNVEFARVRFYPSRGFRNDVRTHCPVHPESEPVFTNLSR